MKTRYVILLCVLAVMVLVMFLSLCTSKPVSEIEINTEKLSTAPCEQKTEWFELEAFTKDAIRDILRHPGGAIIVATDGGLYRSMDEGAHWQRTLTGNSNRLQMDAYARLYVLEDVNPQDVPLNRFYKLKVSNDAGASWQEFPIAATFNATAFTVSAEHDAVWLAGSNGYNHYMSRYSASRPEYRETLSPPPMKPVNFIHTTNDALLMAEADRVFRSDDLGLSWQETKQGFLNNNNFALKEFHYDPVTNLLAITYNGQVAYTQNEASSWASLTPWADSLCSGRTYDYVRVKQVIGHDIVAFSQDEFSVMIFHEARQDSVTILNLGDPDPDKMITAVHYDRQRRQILVAVNEVIPKLSRPMLSGSFAVDTETFYLRNGRILTTYLPPSN